MKVQICSQNLEQIVRFLIRSFKALRIATRMNFEDLEYWQMLIQNAYALDAADERKYCLHENNCAKMEITFVPLAIEVLGGISANFKKILKRLAVLSDNRSFQAQGLSVAFCKLMQSLSITAIRGSAAMLLARAP